MNPSLCCKKTFRYIFAAYCYLLYYHNKRNRNYSSRQTISKACGISDSSVGRAIRHLEQTGLILVQHDFGEDVNVIILPSYSLWIPHPS